MFKEQRSDPREALKLPLKLGDGQPAVTRNISATGMFIDIAGDYQLSGPVVFEMHLVDARMKFLALGEIVRIEHDDGNTGIAVRLVAPRLEPLP